MRRPLCVFCAGMLGVELVCAFLPQTGLFVPLAAFFVAFCLLLCLSDAARKPAVCLLLGAAAGMAAVYSTNVRLERTRVQYAGRAVVLTAEVEKVSDSYYSGIVDAVLRVETVNGKAASFRVECETLRSCEAGQRVSGRFVLSAPEQNDKIERYADGIALLAQPDEEKPEFKILGESSSFRARTCRLQQTLSRSLRRRMDGGTGGVLAAMTVGDRGHLTAELRSAYRGAGLSHVLVVSGMHVSVLCGDLFVSLLSRRRKERSYRSRRVRALWAAFLALVLVGVTGFTPSVRRAAVAVWVSALGIWVYGAPDTLTSLAAAGILMTAGNSYAVCDIGFELSFVTVVGTLAGAECFRRTERARAKRTTYRKGRPPQSPVQLWLTRVAVNLWEAVCISACASIAAFPVLVLRGLSVSIWAVLSGVTVLWMVKPMMLLGLGAAFAGLVPVLSPVYGAVSRAASLLTGLLNAWALWLAQKPGAGIYFDTAYAAVVCLVLIGLCWLAFHWKLRLRAALPCILLTAVVAVGLGNALSRDVVHIDLVGSANAPAIVVSQNDTAVVLFRGGASIQYAVENQLARRGVHTVELLADLRTKPESACTLEAEQTVSAEKLQINTARKQKCTPALVEILRTRAGVLVRLTIGNRQFVTLSGKVELAQPLSAQWLLASPAKPDAVRYENVLALRQYDWMQGGEELCSSLSLRRRGGLKLH